MEQKKKKEEDKKKKQKVAEEAKLEEHRRTTLQQQIVAEEEDEVKKDKYLDEVKELENLFLSFFGSKADRQKDLLVEYYPYQSSINPFKDDDKAPKLPEGTSMHHSAANQLEDHSASNGNASHADSFEGLDDGEVDNSILLQLDSDQRNVVMGPANTIKKF